MKARVPQRGLAVLTLFEKMKIAIQENRMFS